MIPGNHIDQALLRQIANGDEKAFRIFFDHYKERFYAVVLKMTRSDDVAEEIVQETFVKLWRNRATLAEVENPNSYFFTAIYRQVYSYFKKLARERTLFKDIANAENSEHTTEETVIANESERLINEAISKLPSQQQLVFRLSKQEGMTRDQVAEQLHISPNTVRNHMAEAVKFIRSYLGKAVLLSAFINWLLKH